VAATVLAEQAMAALPLTVATVLVGEQAAVATTGTMAAVAGDRTGVTADEGDGNQREEHRNCKTEEPLHN
jgi:hypothetical protein